MLSLAELALTSRSCLKPPVHVLADCAETAGGVRFEEVTSAAPPFGGQARPCPTDWTTVAPPCGGQTFTRKICKLRACDTSRLVMPNLRFWVTSSAARMYISPMGKKVGSQAKKLHRTSVDDESTRGVRHNCCFSLPATFDVLPLRRRRIAWRGAASRRRASHRGADERSGSVASIDHGRHWLKGPQQGLRLSQLMKILCWMEEVEQHLVAAPASAAEGELCSPPTTGLVRSRSKRSTSGRS